MMSRVSIPEGKTPGKFNSSLPYPLKDTRLIEKVFIHSSYLNESMGKGLESNERLEFLGDAVLSLAISRMLYDGFPDAEEGELTNMRAKLVNKAALAGLAESLELGG
ncbi:MAG: ribonuclease III domain-containing protein [Deltaproteobacteria bacterium]